MSGYVGRLLYMCKTSLTWQDVQDTLAEGGDKRLHGLLVQRAAQSDRRLDQYVKDRYRVTATPIDVPQSDPENAENTIIQFRIEVKG